MPATTVTYNEGSWEPIEKNPIKSKRERLSRREGQRKGIYICITILKVNEVNALAIGGHTQPELTLSLKTNHKNIQWRPTDIHKKPNKDPKQRGPGSPKGNPNRKPKRNPEP